MIFNKGDYVTPRKEFLGNGEKFVIKDINLYERKYKLKAVSENDYISEKFVEYREWNFDEIEPYYSIDKKTNFRPGGVIPKRKIVISKINESEENNMNKLLEIYLHRKLKEINKKADEIIELLKEEDEIQEIVAETNRLIQDTDETRVFPKVFLNVYTAKTNEEIESANKSRDRQIKELNEMMEEIEAYFAMTSDYTERKAILKSYDIIDKKGKLNIKED